MEIFFAIFGVYIEGGGGGGGGWGGGGVNLDTPIIEYECGGGISVFRTPIGYRGDPRGERC